MKPSSFISVATLSSLVSGPSIEDMGSQAWRALGGISVAEMQGAQGQLAATQLQESASIYGTNCPEISESVDRLNEFSREAHTRMSTNMDQKEEASTAFTDFHNMVNDHKVLVNDCSAKSSGQYGLTHNTDLLDLSMKIGFPLTPKYVPCESCPMQSS